MVRGRGKEGQRHKSGKRRPRLGGGRGEGSMIATWKVKEEEPHGVHTEGKDTGSHCMKANGGKQSRLCCS